MFYDECFLQLTQDPYFKLNLFAPDTVSQLNVFGHDGNLITCIAHMLLSSKTPIR